MKLIKKLWYFLWGQCTACGGDIEEYSVKNATCMRCGRRE